MAKVKNEEPIKILFFILVCFIFYNFILKPLSLSTAVPPFLRLPVLRCDDFFANLARDFKPIPKEINSIAVVAIDDESLKKADQKWPWKRSTFARLVDKISAQKPAAIYLDFAFSGKSEDESQDEILAESLKNAGNVILGGYIDENGVYNRPQEKLVQAAKDVGFVNKKAFVSDQIVRDMRLAFRGEGDAIDYGAEIKILATALGVPVGNILQKEGRVILPGTPAIPIYTGGFLTINYSVAKDDFLTLSAYRILSDEPLRENNLKDRIVLVGMTANVTHDIHPTPQGLEPGIFIIAQSLLMLVTGSFIHIFSDWSGMGVILCFSLIMGFLSFRLRAVYSTVILLLMLLGASVAYTWLKVNYNFTMDIFGLLFLIFTAYVVVEGYKYLTLLLEAESLKNLAISDPLTGAYTQRYFQLSVRQMLEKRETRNRFFCFLRVSDFKQIEKDYPASGNTVIKKVALTIRSLFAKRSLFARYGEDGFTFIVDKQGLKILERIARDIEAYEFRELAKTFKIVIHIAAVGCNEPLIKNYEDLILTCEGFLGRAQRESSHIAIFNVKMDKIVTAQGLEAEVGALPKDELSYVSMDLDARNKELSQALEDLKKEQKKVEESYFNTMHSLVKALEGKDQYTAGHSERVVKYAYSLAQGLDLPREEVENIRRAAYLHDIGKISLPDRVLHKKERLDDSEYELIKRHQSDGIKILEGLPFFNDIAPYVLYHHERYDGRGYPYGLSGDMIPRGAQIIAVGDSFDAMTTGRGYNKPLSLAEAVEELKKGAGTQFNPVYAAKFVELLEQKKIHAV